MNNQYLSYLKNKRVLVLGFARSGYQTAKILNKYNVEVVLNSNEDLENNIQALELENLGIKVISGSHPLELLNEIDLIVKNPGIPYEIPILQEAMKRNIKIITEVELAYLLYNQEIIAITGTNGKTTTTTLINEILKEENLKVKLAGNIGYPAIEVMDHNLDDSTVVMEISSFQLNGTNEFKPHIALITNLTEAHIDYHKTKEEYHKIKKRIFKNQTEKDYLILNIKDKKLYDKDIIKSKIIYYSTEENRGIYAYISDGYFIYKNQPIFEVKKLSLLGNHNLENCINASIVALLKNVSVKTIQKVLYNFQGVEHRMQYVGEINNVKYYNDSKATNSISTLKALSSFKGNVILICGGKDRGIDFSELTLEAKKIKFMICIGESKFILEKFAKNNKISYHLANKVEDAIKIAFRIAKKNDTVLLSPSCASWDQYKNYEERGNEFINGYKLLEKQESRL